MSAPTPLGRLREDPLTHWIGLLVATGLGLALARYHWLGLIAGGALVGVVATTLKRALLAGLGFGVVALCVWIGSLVVVGAFGEVVATGRFAGIGLLIGLVGPLLGSLVRGVV